MWKFTGNQRPDFAIEPQPGQESVWDYPRPPELRRDSRLVIVRVGDIEIARSTNVVRVLETASPPTVYIPPEDVQLEYLQKDSGSSYCEWKGRATYWSVAISGSKYPGDVSLPNVGWSYDSPQQRFADIKNYLSFYPGRIDCWMGEEKVKPQPGGFYGGWVTSEIVGPWKGEAATGGW